MKVLHVLHHFTTCFAPFLHVFECRNTPTQPLIRALHKSTPIYLVQATPLIPQVPSSWRLHVWHKTARTRLSQLDLLITCHTFIITSHVCFSKYVQSSQRISFLVISWSTRTTYRLHLLHVQLNSTECHNVNTTHCTQMALFLALKLTALRLSRMFLILKMSHSNLVLRQHFLS